MLLGEWQRHAAIAGADEIGFLQIDCERSLDHLLNVGRRRFDRIVRFQHAVERAPEFIAQLACRRPVFHLDDRLVVDVEKQVIGKVRPRARLLRRGSGSAILRYRGRSPICAWRRAHRALAPPCANAETLHRAKSFTPDADLGKALALNLADAGLLEIVELFEKLLETKGPLQRAEERVEIDLAHAHRLALDGTA